MRHSFMLMLMLMLACVACGGGGSDQPDAAASIDAAALPDAGGGGSPDGTMSSSDARLPDAATQQLAYRLTYDDESPVVGSTVKVTAQLLRDGSPVGISGRVISWSGTGEFVATMSTTDVSGRASVQHSVTTLAGATDRVVARDADGVHGEATATTRAAPASPVTSLVRAAMSTLPADGLATTTITVTLRDTYLNVVAGSASSITMASTLGSLGPVTNRGDGSYVATLTAAPAPGTATVTGAIEGAIIGEPATVSFVTGPETGYRVTAASAVGMKTTTTLTAQLVDFAGRDLAQAGRVVTWWNLDEALGSVPAATATTDGNGRATTTFTSAETFADGKVVAIDEAGISGVGKVTIAPGSDEHYFTLVSGGYQSWMPSQTLPVAPKLTYYGPLASHPKAVVAFSTSDGSLTGATQDTNVDGSVAVGSWTLPNVSGLLRMKAHTDTGHDMTFLAEAYGTHDCVCHPAHAGGNCNLALFCHALLTPSGSRLLFSNVTSISGKLTFDVAIQNGETDGALGPGIRLVLESASAGLVLTPAADGTATFTAADQPYYAFSGTLGPGQTSAKRSFTLTFPAAATTLSFRLLVAGPRF